MSGAETEAEEAAAAAADVPAARRRGLPVGPGGLPLPRGVWALFVVPGLAVADLGRLAAVSRACRDAVAAWRGTRRHGVHLLHDGLRALARNLYARHSGCYVTRFDDLAAAVGRHVLAVVEGRLRAAAVSAAARPRRPSALPLLGLAGVAPRLRAAIAAAPTPALAAVLFAFAVDTAAFWTGASAAALWALDHLRLRGLAAVLRAPDPAGALTVLLARNASVFPPAAADIVDDAVALARLRGSDSLEKARARGCNGCTNSFILRLECYESRPPPAWASYALPRRPLGAAALEFLLAARVVAACVVRERPTAHVPPALRARGLFTFFAPRNTKGLFAPGGTRVLTRLGRIESPFAPPPPFQDFDCRGHDNPSTMVEITAALLEGRAYAVVRGGGGDSPPRRILEAFLESTLESTLDQLGADTSDEDDGEPSDAD
jgi:hypothetical protein